MSPALAGGFFTTEQPGMSYLNLNQLNKKIQEAEQVWRDAYNDEIEKGFGTHN